MVIVVAQSHYIVLPLIEIEHLDLLVLLSDVDTSAEVDCRTVTVC